MNTMIDEKYERVMSFVKNHNDLMNKSGISNLYVFTSVDSGGNIIEEKYGCNLLTDYGFTRWMTTTDAFPNTIYNGNGTEEFGLSEDRKSVV